MQINVFDHPMPKLMVVSHERSGTHFLMNSLAACFGYLANPWLDFDLRSTPINFYHAPSVADFFQSLKPHQLANIIKSHHAFEFFQQSLPAMTDQVHVLYIYRDPRAVMASFWRFLHGWEWHEGPRCDSCSEFLSAAPSGQLMRYQWQQKQDMLERWADHVSGWLTAAEEQPRIIPVAYEQLKDNYAECIEEIGTRLDIKPRQITPPDRDTNVVKPKLPTWLETTECRFNEQDEQRIQACLARPALNKLGY